MIRHAARSLVLCIFSGTAALAQDQTAEVLLPPGEDLTIELRGVDQVSVGFDFDAKTAARITPDICPPDKSFSETAMICGVIDQLRRDGTELGVTLLGGAYPGMTTYHELDGVIRFRLTSRATEPLPFRLVYNSP